MKRICMQSWLKMKPYTDVAPTDNYYVSLANQVHIALYDTKNMSELQRYLDQDELAILACFLTSYLEDIVSGTQIWNTFTRLHRKMYKKNLPFYDTSIYYEDEPNAADVAFLMWYFINTMHKYEFVLPFNTIIVGKAEEITEIFDQEYEIAPENNILKSYYHLDADETNYYEARKVIHTILFDTYLFWPDTGLQYLDRLTIVALENKENKNNLSNLINEAADDLLHSFRTCLLALSGKEWAAALMDKTPVADRLREMSPRIAGFFLYESQDDKYLIGKHIASGKRFRILKSSFVYYDDLSVVGTVFYMGIVRWNHEWFFSGIFATLDYDEHLVPQTENDINGALSTAFLDDTAIIEKMRNGHMQSFLTINHGSPIAFMKFEQMAAFEKTVRDFYNTNFATTPREKLPEIQYGDDPFPELVNSKSCILFFNSKSGIEILRDMHNAFPTKDNPFYDGNEADSDKCVKRLLISEDISIEMAKYCIDHYQTKLHFCQIESNKLLLKDLDFLLRFWKKGDTKTVSAYSLINNEQRYY